MPNGSLEGAARLYQGGKAGRGSFLRLAGSVVGAGIVATAVHELEPAKQALAKSATREQRKNGLTASKNGEAKQSATPTSSAQIQAVQKEADSIEPWIDGILLTAIVVGLMIAGGTATKHEEGRRNEGGSREPDPLIQEFQQRIEEDRRQRREGEVAAREEALLEETRSRTRAAVERERLNQQKIDEIAIGKRTIQELTQKLKDDGIDQLAEDGIRNGFWKDKYHVDIQLVPVQEPAVTIKDDGKGTVINRSKSGFILSYYHKDLKYHETRREYYRGINARSDSYGYDHIGDEKVELYLGIGYVKPKSWIRLAGGNEVNYDYPVEEYEKGSRSYLLNRGDSQIAIPVAYPGSFQIFIDLLFQRAKQLAPEQVVPEARERIKNSLGWRLWKKNSRF